MISLPILTPRFVLRPLRLDDAADIADYRSDPSTALWQSWTIPYQVEQAERMITAQLQHSGPTEGEMFGIGIADPSTDRLLGDVAARMEWGGKCVEIGYSLSPDMRGRGIATEAVGAVIDAFFAAGARRVRADTHPDNVASMRVLERLGFAYEGTDRAAYWVGEPPDELVSDNVRFGLPADDRTAWLNRATNTPQQVRFVELSHPMADRYASLHTHWSQRPFVATVLESFADALLQPAEAPWFRGIEADGEPAGFIMMAAATSTSPDPFLWRLLIDRHMQRRGIGSTAVRMLADMVRSAGATRLLVSYVQAPGGPEPMYRSLGFTPTGEVDDGEIVAALPL
jgi:RimJ/RimL family protein N-acetyltransferase